MLYFVLYYFVPYLFGVTTGFFYLDYLDGSPNMHAAIWFVILFGVLFALLYRYLPKLRIGFVDIRFTLLESGLVSLFVAVVFLYFSFLFQQDYGFQYRHKGDPLSDSAPYMLYLMLIRLYINAFIVYCIAVLHQERNLNNNNKLALLLSGVGIALSASVSFDMVAIVVVFMCLASNIAPNFVSMKRQPGMRVLFKSLFYFFVIGFVLVLFGTANKIGFERAVDYLLHDGFGSFIEAVMARISIFLFSLAKVMDEHIADFSFQVAAIMGNLENLQFRIGVLFGLDIPRPELASTGRINSELIYINANDRNGATPGLLGSMFYLPLFPLGLFLGLLYSLFVVRLLDGIFANKSRLALLPVLFLMSVFQTTVDGFPDLANPISLTFIQLMFLIFVRLNVLVPETRMRV
ncbi:hypothetical protein [Planctobacterium marinum]|uniref:hypothetical protein n=1 Tax=Planctobacterium marinum TaxID=1631968 RepID=UPI001E2A8697|nr:hypothetical protein [Planctobacterium marinum]MCC2606144.1 hypothetical protein [Planctobacterium marinum]